MIETYDLAVVGAGFAGLALARRAAERGLKVAVVERKTDPGSQVHTTGILVQEAAQLLAVPDHLVRLVPGVRLYAPSLRHIDLFSPTYAFYATDTPALLRWLAAKAAHAGARIFYRTPFQRAERVPAGLRLDPPGIEATWLVGADGAKSAVAEQFGLGRNRRFLAGLEVELSGVSGLDERFLHTFIDGALAPGYIGWAVPGYGIVQVGIAAKRAEKPQLVEFLDRIGRVFDTSAAEIVARRSGLIPVGGCVAPLGLDRVMLAGDAAGIVSPLTAGGIYTALRYGARAADVIADHVAGEGPSPVETLARDYPKYRAKKWLRAALDLGPPDWLMNALIGTWPLRTLARLVYFHTKGLASRKAWKEIAGR